MGGRAVDQESCTAVVFGTGAGLETAMDVARGSFRGPIRLGRVGIDEFADFIGEIAIRRKLGCESRPSHP